MLDDEIKQYEKIVKSVVYELEFIPEHVDREDVEQIGLLALWKALEDYDESYGVIKTTYCFNVVRIKVLDYLRSQMTKKRKPITLEENGCYKGMEDEVIESQLIAELSKYVSEKDLEIFINRHVHKSQVKEIMEETGLSKRQVEHKLKTVKKVLRKNLNWDGWS